MTVRRVAVVTGATGAIGAAVARALLADGWRVAYWVRNPSKLARELTSPGPTDARAFRVDVTSESDQERAAGETLNHFGSIDLVVVNAGVLRVGSVETMGPQAWHDIFRVNLLGAYLTVRETLAAVRQVEGRYVFMSSVAGKKGLANLSAYSASKAGMNALAESLATEEEKNGVSVTSLILGPVDTPMIDLPGASDHRLAVTEVASTIGWLARLPTGVVMRELTMRPRARFSRS